MSGEISIPIVIALLAAVTTPLLTALGTVWLALARMQQRHLDFVEQYAKGTELQIRENENLKRALYEKVLPPIERLKVLVEERLLPALDKRGGE